MTVVTARCQTARSIGTNASVAIAASTIRSAEYAFATWSGGPSSSRMRSSASRSLSEPSDAAMRSRRCDSISRTASRTTSIGRNVLSERSRTKRYPFTRDWPGSVRFTVALPAVGPRGCGDQPIDLVGKRAPFRLHLAQPSRTRPGQPVVLARVRRFAFDPCRLEDALARQPAEDRIDRPFGDDQIGEGFEVLNDVEAVPRSLGNGQENREIETAAAELFEPGFARHTLCHKASTRPDPKKFRLEP